MGTRYYIDSNKQLQQEEWQEWDKHLCAGCNLEYNTTNMYHHRGDWWCEVCYPSMVEQLETEECYAN